MTGSYSGGLAGLPFKVDVVREANSHPRFLLNGRELSAAEVKRLEEVIRAAGGFWRSLWEDEREEPRASQTL